tara:strand:+ start:564 stop:1175 length:612 start_codon:yes stop_codon:yes gene_type:complete
MAKEQIFLNKKVYGIQSIKDSIDREFVEFSLKNFEINELFNIYNALFYDISLRGTKSHSSIVKESTKYAGYPRNPLLDEIENLEEQIVDIKEEIDSIEDEHPFIKNHSVIRNRNDEQLNYYIQSGRKRQINNDDAFKAIKTQTGKIKLPDSEFVILLNSQAIGGIVSGPPINTVEDISIDVLEINRFSMNNSDLPAPRNIHRN